MKREEAIKLIDTHTVCFYNEIDSPTLQALHLAIEALQKDIERHEMVIRASERHLNIVRCKDCRFSEIFQNDSSGVMAMYCRAFTFKRMVSEDDYCSYGERQCNYFGERREP